MKITKTSFLAVKNKINDGADNLFLKNTLGISDTSIWRIKKSKNYADYKKLINSHKADNHSDNTTFGDVSPMTLLQEQHELTVRKIDQIIEQLIEIKNNLK